MEEKKNRGEKQRNAAKLYIVSIPLIYLVPTHAYRLRLGLLNSQSVSLVSLL